MVAGAATGMGCGVENGVAKSDGIVTKDPFDWMNYTFSSRFASGYPKKQSVVDFSHSQGSGEGSCKYIGANEK